MPTTASVLADLRHEVRGSGPPVLFISGASGDAGHFARTAEHLTDESTSVACDRRGCSRSAALPNGASMSIAAQADEAAALIEELELAPAIVFGTSGGGNILLELIARRPDVLRGAIVHEPGLLALAEPTDVEAAEMERIVGLAAMDPVRATVRFSEQLGCDVGSISGHHAPYLQQPEAFAEELRPILRELV